MSKDIVIFIILVLSNVVVFIAFVNVYELRFLMGGIMLILLFLTGIKLEDLVEKRHERS